MKTIMLPTKLFAGKWSSDGMPRCFEGWINFLSQDSLSSSAVREQQYYLEHEIKQGVPIEISRLEVQCRMATDLLKEIEVATTKHFGKLLGENTGHVYLRCLNDSVAIPVAEITWIVFALKRYIPEFVTSIPDSEDKEVYHLIWKGPYISEKVRSVLFHRLLIDLGYKVELFDLKCDKPDEPLLLTYQPEPATVRKEQEPVREQVEVAVIV